MSQEKEVSVDAIDSALGELLKAADATDLSKAYGGVAVDQGGHVDERGQTKGGKADKGDVGSLDDMMIGKMADALIDAGFEADAIAAFMKGKIVGPSDMDEEEEEESAKMKDADEEEEDKAEKSDEYDFAKSAFQKSDIEDAVNVAPFLEALVDSTVESIDGLSKSLSAGQAKQTEMNKATAVAMAEMGNMIKSLAARLGVVERQPNPQRGYTSTVSGARPLAKSFGQFGSENSGAEQLTKSEVCRTLSYMNLEKGIKEIGGKPTSEIVSLYEAGGSLHPHALNAVHRFLATNPGDAASAKSYR